MPLSVENIEKSYKWGHFKKVPFQVLKGVSLEIRQGETVGLMGDSGSGKSTLGRVLAGLENPTSGKILYEGTDISRMGREERHLYRRSVQMVFQDPASALNPMKTIRRSLEDVAKLAGIKAGGIEDAIQEMLIIGGLDREVLRRYPDQISGGQIQRIALSRVIFHRPSYLILDEPTSALDVSVQAQILQLLRNIQKETGVGYLFISHDEAVVRFISNRVMRLSEGVLLSDDPPRIADNIHNYRDTH